MSVGDQDRAGGGGVGRTGTARGGAGGRSQKAVDGIGEEERTAHYVKYAYLCGLYCKHSKGQDRDGGCEWVCRKGMGALSCTVIDVVSRGPLDNVEFVKM